tara:strand:+ start:289 stop:507 length:219 start_codon:yes stop_codon:yes gene_type:complete
MKHLGNVWLSLGAPLLILVAIVGLLQREGRARVQVIPAFCIGGGLIITSSIKRNRRRKKLFFAIRDSPEEEN